MENNTFRKLLGNGLTYPIPRFQRDYTWTQDDWEELWQDVQGTLQTDGETAHYLGYLVLQSADDKTFDVIDGQQRLTTITILLLAILKNLQRLIDAGNDAASNQRRLDQMRQTYIGYLDPVTLVARPKLTLNRNNNYYFQTYLAPLGRLPQRGLRASEHALRKAFAWFDQRVSEHLIATAGNEGMRLAQLGEDLSDRLFFTVITVTDELNAYKVFETLNARRVRLSATDLLKNYLFSLLDSGAESDPELRSLEDRWEFVVGRLQAENFPDFLRAHWNSRHPFARHSDLFKTIRSAVRTRQVAFELLREIEEDLDTYLALSSPEPSDWSPEDKRLAATLKLFRVRQPFPLLLAARRTFAPADFTALLRATVVISTRFNVICSYGTGEQERRYNEVAEGIANGQLTTLTDALPRLRSIYPEDQVFRSAFPNKTIRTTDSRNNKVVRFLLCAIEKHLSGQDLDFASATFNIEHVLPQNAPDGWGGIGNDDAEALLYRLGNMTLLEANRNGDLANREYGAKRSVFAQSSFAITSKLAADHAEWTPDRIAAHQNWMAHQAVALWRIPQLS
ncbi:MAG: DUF262 domain-containing protein [Acidobacteriaceae bacterium]|nr:DUF262 domain-containing protein [Acidobacteriaceae bacterium]